MDKKAQVNLNKTIQGGAIIVITVVVLLSIFSSLVPEVQTAGDSLNVSNRCAAVGCFFNETDNANTSVAADCRTNSSITGQACSDPLGQGIPLSGLFSSSGIIVLLLMVALVFIIISTVLPKKSKK